MPSIRIYGRTVWSSQLVMGSPLQLGEKAQSLNIDLIEFESPAAPTKVARLVVGEPGTVWTKVGEVMPRSIFVAVENDHVCHELEVGPESGLWRLIAGHPVQFASVASVVEMLVRSSRSEVQMSTPFSELDVVSQVELVSVAEEDFDQPVFMRPGSEGELLQLKRIRVLADATHRSRRVPLAHGTLGGVPAAFARWKPEGEPKMMVVTEADQPRITIVDDPGA